jgi:uncharacterized RDD family membrane protein YckC
MYCQYCGRAIPEYSAYCSSCGRQVSQQAPPQGWSTQAPYGSTSATLAVQYSDATVAFGGFWIRLVAYFVDYVIIALGSYILGLVAGGLVAVAALVSGPTTREASVSMAAAFGGLIGFVWVILYYVLLPPIYGGTPGKLVFGYHIVEAETFRHVGYGRSAGRYFSQILSALVFCLGYIWIGIDANKQAWHDKIAGTYVVRKEHVRI